MYHRVPFSLTVPLSLFIFSLKLFPLTSPASPYPPFFHSLVCSQLTFLPWLWFCLGYPWCFSMLILLYVFYFKKVCYVRTFCHIISKATFPEDQGSLMLVSHDYDSVKPSTWISLQSCKKQSPGKLPSQNPSHHPQQTWRWRPVSRLWVMSWCWGRSEMRIQTTGHIWWLPGRSVVPEPEISPCVEVWRRELHVGLGNEQSTPPIVLEELLRQYNSWAC